MQRRTLLKGAAAGSLTALSHSALSQVAEQPVRTAMIGTGNRGGWVLKEIMQQPGVKVIALCDIKPARLDAAASTAARE